MKLLNDKKIIDSWQKNVAPWTTAIRDGQIESREQVTNQAIINAVMDYAPKSVIDIGCGEGWLVRELCGRGIDVLGTDVVAGLIEQAREMKGGRFDVFSYEELAAGKLTEKFDAAVCNFSLLGNESVVGLFKTMPFLLNQGGVFIVQTIHPLMGCGESRYEDGWREGSWDGFSNDFVDPAPWFFRRLESWITLFATNGFSLLEMREPAHPQTGKPSSVIFIGKL